MRLFYKSFLLSVLLSLGLGSVAPLASAEEIKGEVVEFSITVIDESGNKHAIPFTKAKLIKDIGEGDKVVVKVEGGRAESVKKASKQKPVKQEKRPYGY